MKLGNIKFVGSEYDADRLSAVSIKVRTNLGNEIEIPFKEFRLGIRSGLALIHRKYDLYIPLIRMYYVEDLCKSYKAWKDEQFN